ncbi:MAG TPA: YceH family protein [Wenzhouxiangella sp.]|nr:YceH family protein [Wenzhouxiangella sp.]
MTEDNEQIATCPLDPPLSSEEARVLGCLVEKEATTPESYPLTQNACVTAANQKTSRHPIMKLDPGRVGQALRQLEQRELVRSEFGARASRYAHKVDDALSLTPPQRALLGLLMLRGPQTLNELLARSERLHRFDDLDEVRFCLERMMSRDAPLVILLGRGAGQREDRYSHTLTGRVESAERSASEPAAGGTSGALEGRVSALEERMAALEAGMKMLLPGGARPSA